MNFLFARDGHLLDLGIDGLLAEELSAEGQAQVDEHLAACEPCRLRVDEARALLAEPLPPLRALPVQDAPTEALPPAQDLPGPANNNRMWMALGSVLALAAAMLLFVLPEGEQPDTFTARGGQLHLEVYKQTEGTSQLLVDGDRVAPGDTLGFRVELSEQAHLALVGADSNDAVYAIWPPQGGSAPIGPTAQPEQLSAAIQLDATPGVERLLAVACPQPFQLSDEQVRSVSETGSSAQLLEGCTQELVRLDKAQP